MAHSVGEQAARAVKNSERKRVLETRSPEEIIKGLRGNLAAHLAVTPSDTAFLLAQYDLVVASLGIANLDVEQKDDVIAILQEKLDSEHAAVLHLGEATPALLSRAETAEAQYQVAVKRVELLQAELALIRGEV